VLPQVKIRRGSRQFTTPSLQHTEPLLFMVKRQHLFCLRQESMVFSNQLKAHHDYLYICNSTPVPAARFDG
jgi:hypothetical protein